MGVCVLAGCSSAPNDRLSVGGDALPALETSAGVARADDVPSAGVMDRSAWAPVILRSGVDATHHQPTYRFGPVYANSALRARQRGAFPNVATCLETEGDAGACIGEALAAPVLAAGEIVLFPFGAIFVQPPWADALSPSLGYERTARRAETSEGTAR